jgi:PAS domain S-box-containing protein
MTLRDESSSQGEPSTSSDGSALYRLLVDSVRDYAIFVLDPRGHVLTWNAGAQQLKGYTTEEIVGRHLSVFYPPSEVEASKPAIELETATRVGRYEDEGWRVRRDGSMFWANVILTALRDDTGELVGFAKITRDLSERRAAEEQARALAAETAARAEAQRRSAELDRINLQLQQQTIELEVQTEEAQSLTEELEQANEQLQDLVIQAEESRAVAEAAEQFSRGILESIADPFVVHDADWRFRYINERAAEIFGWSGHESRSMIGQVLWDAYPEIVGSIYEREMRRAVAGRAPVSFEAHHLQRAEWSSLHCYPLANGGLATQWRDITDR